MSELLGHGYGESLSIADVARIFSVNPQTVRKWSDSGKLHHFTTPGGRYRYFTSEVEAKLRGEEWNPPEWYKELRARRT